MCAATALVGHAPSGPCFEVTTQYGRSIRVTADHSLFVEGRGGVPVARTVSDLRVGDRVAIAGRVDVAERDRTAISMVEVAEQAGRDELLGRSAELPATVDVTDELLWVLGLWVAEGSSQVSHEDAYITISSGLDQLARAAKVFERDLGLHVVRAPATESHGAAIFVHGRHLLALWDFLGFGANRKRIPGWVLGLPLDRLKWFVEGYREGDGVRSAVKLAEEERHEFSTVSEELKDDLIVALGRFGICPSVGRDETAFWRITATNVAPWSPLEWDRGVTQTLNARRTGDLVWAVITSITEVEPTDLVYDFAVPGRENFYAGSGIMAHNTYGPLMRPDDGRAVSNFVVQALRGDPITIFGDGTQTRSFTYVDDQIRGFLALLDSRITTPVNIGNPDEITILELAELVLEPTRLALSTRVPAAARRRPRPAPAGHHQGARGARLGAEDRPSHRARRDDRRTSATSSGHEDGRR